jgi:prepilin-type N-terminal cleavage/methylation domain-containing protein
MSRAQRGFTLIELLIVIGILAVLATLVILVLNPAELFKQSRDIRRLNDIKTLTAMVNYARFAGKLSSTPNKRVDVSVPDTISGGDLCPTVTAIYPLADGAWSRWCAIPNDYLKLNGTGWLQVDFGDPFSFNEMNNWVQYTAAIPQANLNGALASKLPIDPVNTAAGGLHYSFVHDAGDFEFVVTFESAKYQTKASTDGGSDAGRYETGENMTLWADAMNCSGAVFPGC